MAEVTTGRCGLMRDISEINGWDVGVKWRGSWLGQWDGMLVPFTENETPWRRKGKKDSWRKRRS